MKMLCNTKELKKKGFFNRSKFYFHSTHNPKTEAAALFNGTIHFVAFNFGGASMSMSDIQVGLSHAIHSCPAISQYCSQYGPNTINVDSNIISFNTPNRTF